MGKQPGAEADQPGADGEDGAAFEGCGEDDGGEAEGAAERAMAGDAIAPDRIATNAPPASSVVFKNISPIP